MGVTYNSAQDSLVFLVQWLDRFPRYKHREVYITGESYAGHYVPQLAREIMTYNAKYKRAINLKGIMVKLKTNLVTTGLIHPILSFVVGIESNCVAYRLAMQ